MTFGPTADGYNRKTIDDIKADIEAKQLADIDTNADFDPDQPLGQLNGIIASAIAEVWEADESTYHSYDPNSAEGDALVNIALITGTDKRPATFSTVPVTMTIDAGGTASAGMLFAVAGRPDILFALDANVTNPAGVPADLPGTATAEDSGPVQALAGTLTGIVNPGSVSAVTNPLDAELGHAADTNTTLRQRRERQLALRGGSTVDAITADLLEVETISDVLMLWNDGDHYDPETGLPAHSFEAFIDDDGLTPDNDVAQVIWDSKPTGIKPYGNTTGFATDNNDQTQTILFGRPENKLIWIDLTISISTQFPDDGEAQIKAAVVAKCAQTFGVSDDVIGLVIEATCISVIGVTNATAKIGFAEFPDSTDDLAIGFGQKAKFDSSRITIEYPLV